MMAAERIAGTTLGRLLGAEAGALADVEIADLVLDSREVTPGAAFVALAGARDHGLNHFEQAVARGAAAVLYEPAPGYTSVPAPGVAVPGLTARLGELALGFFGRDQPQPQLAGVTGTNGKTTVAWLVAQAMSRHAGPCAYIGTLGYGVPPDVDSHALTTPDCFTLHRELAALAAPRGVLEVSSHALAQDRIAGLTFAAAAFTNLSRDHLDYHGDLASYGRAKARLFERAGLETAVLNVADPFVAELAARLDGVETLRVATTDRVEADLVARVTARGLDGLELEIGGRAGRARLGSPLLGEFNAENLVVALGLLLTWDLRLTDACALLEHCAPPPGRMEAIRRGDGPTAVVDYAHTPAGLERALEAVRALAPGEVWCVFGCGGERDPGKRAAMGAVAARSADHVVLTDDNPRGEDPSAIIADIRSGMGAHGDVRVERPREAAIRAAMDAARSGDVVLVAGKGSERVQVTADGPRPFSDRDVAADALGAAS